MLALSTPPRLATAAQRLAAVALLMVLIAAGCASTTATGARSAPDALPTPIPAPTGAGPNGEQVSLEVVDVEGLAIITNSAGMAVYGNERDTLDEIFCIESDCTDVWVPLQPRDAFISSRLDSAKYQVLSRPDGIDQVTYDGTPLYVWTGDTLVGYPQGAGVAGLWFGLTADGQRVQ